jgi:hypothetical protein
VEITGLVYRSGFDVIFQFPRGAALQFSFPVLPERSSENPQQKLFQG